MTELSVNINKLATLRNARGTNLPDLIKFTKLIISYGARGITVHPRPDGRHIKYDDVYAISKFLNDYNNENNKPVEFNIEGYPNKSFLNLIQEIRPHQCTLVPDPPDALTSNSGWDIKNNLKLLTDVKNQLSESKTRLSVFVDPLTFNKDDFTALETLKPQRVEIYTEPFAKTFSIDSESNTVITKAYQIFTEEVAKFGVGINAGHDLNTKNLKHLVTVVPLIEEVSIGHALICDSLIDGLETTIKKYQSCLN